MWISSHHTDIIRGNTEVEISTATERRVRNSLGAGVRAGVPSGTTYGTPSPAGIRSLLLNLSILLLVCGLAPAHRALAAAVGLYHVEEIKPKVFVWVPEDVIDQECDPYFPRAATAGFIESPDGVVVVDTANSPMNARDLLYEIRKHTTGSVRFVINTSAEPDHMLGNEVFVDEQATVISTKIAQAEMGQYGLQLSDRMRGEDGWRLRERMRGFHVTPSTQTFDGNMSLNLGGQEIRMTALLAGKSLQDAVVYLPSAKVLFLGELFDNQYFPRIGSRDVHRWIDVLRQVETWDVDTYVPGHGSPGSKNDLVAFRKFLEWIVAQVEMRLKQGQSPADVQRTLWLPRTYHWHATDMAPDTVADVCRQLAPPPATPTPPPAPPQPGGE